MAQESVEIVSAAIDAWNRGDFDAWISAWDEQAEFYPVRAQLEGHAYHRHAAAPVRGGDGRGVGAGAL